MYVTGEESLKVQVERERVKVENHVTEVEHHVNLRQKMQKLYNMQFAILTGDLAEST